MEKKRLFVDDKGRPHGTVVLNWHGSPEREFSYFAEAFHLVAKDAVAVYGRTPTSASMASRPRISVHIPLSSCIATRLSYT